MRWTRHKRSSTRNRPAQLQQLSQLAQMLTKEVHSLSEERESKTLELASAERQTAIRALASIRVAEVNASKDMQSAAADRDAAQLEQMMAQSHEFALEAANADQQQSSQDSQQTHERET